MYIKDACILQVTPLIVGIECCEVDDLVDVFIPGDHNETKSAQIYESARSSFSHEPVVIADTLTDVEWSMREKVLKEINRFIAASRKVAKSQVEDPTQIATTTTPFAWNFESIHSIRTTNSESDQLSSLLICSALASMYAQDFDKRVVATEKFCEMFLKSFSPTKDSKYVPTKRDKK